MSQKQMRAVAMLLLHQQSFGSGLPPLAVRPELVPVVEAEVIVARPAPPQPWYRRAWAWLVARYHLDGWTP